MSERMFLLVPNEEHEICILLVDGLMVNPCGLTSAPVVVELFPPGSINMRVRSSINWEARHMIEMCALEGKNIACINGDSLDTLEKHF